MLPSEVVRWKNSIPTSYTTLLKKARWLIRQRLDLVQVWHVLYMIDALRVSYQPSSDFRAICMYYIKPIMARSYKCFHFMSLRQKKDAYCVYRDRKNNILAIRKHKIGYCPDSEYQTYEGAPIPKCERAM
jgi:hypothetical protein